MVPVFPGLNRSSSTSPASQSRRPPSIHWYLHSSSQELPGEWLAMPMTPTSGSMKNRQWWDEIEPLIWALAFSKAVACEHCQYCLSLSHASSACGDSPGLPVQAQAAHEVKTTATEPACPNHVSDGITGVHRVLVHFHPRLPQLSQG